MLRPLTKAAVYNVARRTGRLRPRPLNLTFSVTYRCNAMCRTCNVWKKRVQDLTLVEYERIFHSLGSSLYWATFSGGEPFIRPDLIDIVTACYDHCHPAIVTIPTNGLLRREIVDGVARLSRHAPDMKIVINFSLDGIGTRHDEIRKVRGNYDRLREAYRELKAAAHPNVTVGIHTVVSQFNVTEVPAIREHVRREFKPDSFITELAEERLELDTIGENITPAADAYAAVVRRPRRRYRRETGAGVRIHHPGVPARVLPDSRIARWSRSARCCPATPDWRRRRSPRTGTSGPAASAPNRWAICAKPASISTRCGPVRKADELRGSIRRGECFCPLANAAYSSMLCDPASARSRRLAMDEAPAPSRRPHRRDAVPDVE